MFTLPIDAVPDYNVMLLELEIYTEIKSLQIL